MKDNNSPSSINNKQSLYQFFDAVSSFIARCNEMAQPLWWLERKKGSKTYTPMIKVMDKDISLFDAIKSIEPLDDYLKSLGWSEKNLIIRSNQAVTQLLHQDKWSAKRIPELNVVRSPIYRPSIMQWSNNAGLAHLYWKNRCQEVSFGSKMDIKFFNLHDLITTKDASKKNIKEIEKILDSIFVRRRSWELESSQSFRYWASMNKDERAKKQFNKMLDNRAVSYRNFHEGTPIVLRAIEENKFDILKGWMSETNLSCNFTPLHNEVPDSWWPYDEQKPSTSLWGWMCYISSLDMIKKSLDLDPSLIDSKDFSNKNAMHWACLSAREEVIEFLISKGASVEVKDNEGYIPSELIPETHDDLFNMLEKYRKHQKKIDFSSLLENKRDNRIVQ